MQERNELNRQLASLLGWTDFEAAGGALLGSPPYWAGNSRGQAQAPDWEGDWRHAGVLMVQHHCMPWIDNDIQHGDIVRAKTPGSHVPASVVVSEFRGYDSAYRAAIVKAVIQKLGPRQG